MSEQEKEALSAFLDGESDDLELRRLSKSWDAESELAKTFARYNLAQALLHDRGATLSDDFAARVQTAVRQEDALDTPNDSSYGWRHGFTRVAVAACVSLLVLAWFQYQLPAGAGPELAEQADRTADSVSVLNGTALMVSEPVNIEVDPIAQQRLIDYIRRVTIDDQEPLHSEHLQDSPLYRLVNEFQARNPREPN